MIRKRPICFLCLFLIGLIYVLDGIGFSTIKGNPIPENINLWIRQHPKVIVCGKVKTYSETEKSQSVILKNTYLIYKSKKIPIKNIKIFLKEKEKLSLGAMITASGILKEIEEPRNPGEFNIKQYYACEHIFYQMTKGEIEKIKKGSGYYEILSFLKEKFKDILQKSAGEDADVFISMLLGDKSDLEEEKKNLYQLGGIIHILAISGLHISILGIGFYNLLKKIGWGIFPAAFLALVLMVQYSLMTGGSVSSQRAVIMFVLSIGAKILGRIYDRMTALAIAALIIVLESPGYLYSGNFLMSFGAVIAILVIVPEVEKIFKTENKLWKSFIASLTVFFTTLPIMLKNYGEVSLLGVFLNIFVLSTVGIILICGISAIISGFLWIKLSLMICIPGKILLSLYEGACSLLGRVSVFTWIPGEPELWQIIVYYLLFIWMLSGIKGENKKSRILRSFLLFTAVFIISEDFEKKNLEITQLDVGQGDCAVIKTPEEKFFIIDGGSSSNKEVGKNTLIPYLKHKGIAKVSGILISHTDKDHISGIEELLIEIKERRTSLRVDTLLLPDWKEPPESWVKLKRAAKEAGTEVKTIKKGDLLRMGEVTIQVLWPLENSKVEDTNEESQVLLLEYKDFQALFTGDIGFETETKIKENLKDIDFLKVAHHGSAHSSGEEFLEHVRPEISVISCGENNLYGHPSKETINRLEKTGSEVEYTMKNGAICVNSDGKGMEVKRFLSS